MISCKEEPENSSSMLGVRLVWCKYGSHPWWPAVVTGTKGELKVDFGDQEFGVVEPGFVEDFQSGAFTDRCTSGIVASSGSLS